MLSGKAGLIGAMVVTLAAAAVAAPAVSKAAQCGPGTFYDAATDSCLVAAPPPPPPPPPPPAWNAPTPWVSAAICAPVPILNLCVGV